MSSVIRKFSQIPVRTKYLLVVGDAVTTGTVSEVSAFTVAPGSFNPLLGTYRLTSTATEAEVEGAPEYEAVDLSGGALYKDLGRQITIYDDAAGSYGRHLAVFRQVQKVEGAETEGVCDSANYCANIFVKVWSADGTGVVVVRTG
jgi:hypothetical protein